MGFNDSTGAESMLRDALIVRWFPIPSALASTGACQTSETAPWALLAEEISGALRASARIQVCRYGTHRSAAQYARPDDIVKWALVSVLDTPILPRRHNMDGIPVHWRWHANVAHSSQQMCNDGSRFTDVVQIEDFSQSVWQSVAAHLADSAVGVAPILSPPVLAQQLYMSQLQGGMLPAQLAKLKVPNVQDSSTSNQRILLFARPRAAVAQQRGGSWWAAPAPLTHITMAAGGHQARSSFIPSDMAVTPAAHGSLGRAQQLVFETALQQCSAGPAASQHTCVPDSGTAFLLSAGSSALDFQLCTSDSRQGSVTLPLGALTTATTVLHELLQTACARLLRPNATGPLSDASGYQAAEQPASAFARGADIDDWGGVAESKGGGEASCVPDVPVHNTSSLDATRRTDAALLWALGEMSQVASASARAWSIGMANLRRHVRQRTDAWPANASSHEDWLQREEQQDRLKELHRRWQRLAEDHPQYGARVRPSAKSGGHRAVGGAAASGGAASGTLRGGDTGDAAALYSSSLLDGPALASKAEDLSESSQLRLQKLVASKLSQPLHSTQRKAELAGVPIRSPVPSIGFTLAGARMNSAWHAGETPRPPHRTAGEGTLVAKQLQSPPVLVYHGTACETARLSQERDQATSAWGEQYSAWSLGQGASAGSAIKSDGASVSFGSYPTPASIVSNKLAKLCGPSSQQERMVFNEKAWVMHRRSLQAMLKSSTNSEAGADASLPSLNLPKHLDDLRCLEQHATLVAREALWAFALASREENYMVAGTSSGRMSNSHKDPSGVFCMQQTVFDVTVLASQLSRAIRRAKQAQQAISATASDPTRGRSQQIEYPEDDAPVEQGVLDRQMAQPGLLARLERALRLLAVGSSHPWASFSDGRGLAMRHDSFKANSQYEGAKSDLGWVHLRHLSDSSLAFTPGVPAGSAHPTLQVPAALQLRLSSKLNPTGVHAARIQAACDVGTILQRVFSKPANAGDLGIGLLGNSAEHATLKEALQVFSASKPVTGTHLSNSSAQVDMASGISQLTIPELQMLVGAVAGRPAQLLLQHAVNDAARQFKQAASRLQAAQKPSVMSTGTETGGSESDSSDASGAKVPLPSVDVPTTTPNSQRLVATMIAELHALIQARLQELQARDDRARHLRSLAVQRVLACPITSGDSRASDLSSAEQGLLAVCDWWDPLTVAAVLPVFAPGSPGLQRLPEHAVVQILLGAAWHAPSGVSSNAVRLVGEPRYTQGGASLDDTAETPPHSEAQGGNAQRSVPNSYLPTLPLYENTSKMWPPYCGSEVILPAAAGTVVGAVCVELKLQAAHTAGVPVGPHARPPSVYAALMGQGDLLKSIVSGLSQPLDVRSGDGLSIADASAAGGTPGHAACFPEAGLIKHAGFTGSAAGAAADMALWAYRSQPPLTLREKERHIRAKLKRASKQAKAQGTAATQHASAIHPLQGDSQERARIAADAAILPPATSLQLNAQPSTGADVSNKFHQQRKGGKLDQLDSTIPFPSLIMTGEGKLALRGDALLALPPWLDAIHTLASAQRISALTASYKRMQRINFLRDFYSHLQADADMHLKLLQYTCGPAKLQPGDEDPANLIFRLLARQKAWPLALRKMGVQLSQFLYSLHVDRVNKVPFGTKFLQESLTSGDLWIEALRTIATCPRAPKELLHPLIPAATAGQACVSWDAFFRNDVGSGTDISLLTGLRNILTRWEAVGHTKTVGGASFEDHSEPEIPKQHDVVASADSDSSDTDEGTRLSATKSFFPLQQVVPSRTTLHCAVLGGDAMVFAFTLFSAPHLLQHPDAEGFTPVALATALGRTDMLFRIFGELHNGSSTPAPKAGSSNFRSSGVQTSILAGGGTALSGNVSGDTVAGRWSLGNGLAHAFLSSRTGNAAQDTLLHLAARGAHVNTTGFLLSRGAAVSAANAFGDTALHHCVMLTASAIHGFTFPSCHPAMSHGQSQKHGSQLRDAANAVSGDARACLKLLLRAGARLVPNCSGVTPLHIAAAAGDVYALKHILSSTFAEYGPSYVEAELHRTATVRAHGSDRALTPLDFAVAAGSQQAYVDARQVLLEAAAAVKSAQMPEVAGMLCMKRERMTGLLRWATSAARSFGVSALLPAILPFAAASSNPAETRSKIDRHQPIPRFVQMQPGEVRRSPAVVSKSLAAALSLSTAASSGDLVRVNPAASAARYPLPITARQETRPAAKRIVSTEGVPPLAAGGSSDRGASGRNTHATVAHPYFAMIPFFRNGFQIVEPAALARRQLAGPPEAGLSGNGQGGGQLQPAKRAASSPERRSRTPVGLDSPVDAVLLEPFLSTDSTQDCAAPLVATAAPTEAAHVVPVLPVDTSADQPYPDEEVGDDEDYVYEDGRPVVHASRAELLRAEVLAGAGAAECKEEEDIHAGRGGVDSKEQDIGDELLLPSSAPKLASIDSALSAEGLTVPRAPSSALSLAREVSSSLAYESAHGSTAIEDAIKALTPTGTLTVRGCTVWTPLALRKHMYHEASVFAEATGLTPVEASLLLRHHQWRSAAALEALDVLGVDALVQARILPADDSEGFSVLAPKAVAKSLREARSKAGTKEESGAVVEGLPASRPSPGLASASEQYRSFYEHGRLPTAEEIEENELELECPVCLDDLQPHEMYSLTCGHNVCLSCWQGHLDAVILQGAQCVYEGTCPMSGCEVLMPDATWERFGEDAIVQLGSLSDAGAQPDADDDAGDGADGGVGFGQGRGGRAGQHGGTIKRPPSSSKTSKLNLATAFDLFLRYLTRAYAAAMPGMVKCANPVQCDNLISAPDSGTLDLTCSCGWSFCSACAMEAHGPAPCWAVQAWRAHTTAANDSSSVNYMKNTFRSCPRCKASISKAGGCKHMTCSACDYHFCWNCGTDWNAAGGYSHQCAGSLWSSSVFGVWIWNNFVAAGAGTAGAATEVPTTTTAKVSPAGKLGLAEARARVDAMDMAGETVRARLQYMCEAVELVQQVVRPLPLPKPLPAIKLVSETKTSAAGSTQRAQPPSIGQRVTMLDELERQNAILNRVNEQLQQIQEASQALSQETHVGPFDASGLFDSDSSSDDTSTYSSSPELDGRGLALDEEPAAPPQPLPPIGGPPVQMQHTLVRGSSDSFGSSIESSLDDDDTVSTGSGASRRSAAARINTEGMSPQASGVDVAEQLLQEHDISQVSEEGSPLPGEYDELAPGVNIDGIIPPGELQALRRVSQSLAARGDEVAAVGAGAAAAEGGAAAVAAAVVAPPPSSNPLALLHRELLTVGTAPRGSAAKRLLLGRGLSKPPSKTLTLHFEDSASLTNADMPKWMSALATMHVELTPMHEPEAIVHSAKVWSVHLHSWRARRRVLVAALRVLYRGLRFARCLEMALYFIRAGDAIRSKGGADSEAHKLVVKIMDGLRDSTRDELVRTRMHLLSTVERLFGATDIFAVSLENLSCSDMATLACALLKIIGNVEAQQAWRQTWLSPGLVPNRG